ncbi:hypothetical protein NCC49_002198 [Naganishia albida]|nr:hypothetical protein NCC49_002198 [Naganishia albida]
MAASDNEQSGKGSEEIHGRKRGRETSVEPGLNQSTSGSAIAIPLKKNRTEPLGSVTSSRGTSPKGKDGSNGGVTATTSDETVKEVRKKVEDLSHDESVEALEDDMSDKEGAQTVTIAADVDQADSEAGRKRKLEDRTPSSQVLPEDSKRVKDADVEEPPVSAVPSVDMDRPKEGIEAASVPPATTTAAPVKKPQATFGSFASSSSPFSKVTTSTAGLDSSDVKALPDDVAQRVKEANALPTTSSSSSTSVSNAPVKRAQSSFGSFASSASPFSAVKHTSAFTAQPVASSSNATSHSASPFKSTTGSAFGNWSASASPFATPSRKPTPNVTGDEASKDEVPKDDDKQADATQDKQDHQNFGDILASTSGEAAAERQKLDVQHQDVPTGEEEENTIFQVRSKLHVMDGGAWKERGTGSLHLNIHKKDRSARLVMRAEGVLRLILNTPLYAGMKPELTDRYVKFAIVEEGKIRNIAIRTRNVDEAKGLFEAMQRYIPAKDKAETPPQVQEPVGEEAV